MRRYARWLVVACSVILPMLCTVADTAAAFTLCSPAVVDGGNLPVEFTGDGASATLPLAWNNVPIGTQSFTLIMHHVAPDITKWYWTLYNIPADVKSLPKNVQEVGTQGTNSVNHQVAYAPPHSKGPGAKTYIYTVYALDMPLALKVPTKQVTRDVLLEAMEGHILGSATLSVVYTRFVEDQSTPDKTGAAGKSVAERQPAPHDFDCTPLSRALDVNADSMLNIAEITDAVKHLLTLDVNHDGTLGAMELDGAESADHANGPKRPVGGPLMRVLDADRDSALSAAEIANAVTVLKAADADKDGRVTVVEVDAVNPDQAKQTR